MGCCQRVTANKNEASVSRSSSNAVVEQKCFVETYPSNTPVTHFKFNDNTTDSTGNITPTLTTPNIVRAHLPLNGNDTDIGPNAYVFTENNITYASGKISEAAVFNGTNSYIQRTTFGLNNQTLQSICAWIYVDAIGNQQAITSYASLAAFTVETDGRLAIELQSNSGNGRKYFSTNTIPAQTWTHVAVVYNCTMLSNISRKANDASLYINGVRETTTTSTTGLTSTTSTTFNIGTGSSNLYFSGMIDDLRVYNVTLVDSEISWIYNGGTGREDDFTQETYVPGVVSDAIRLYSNSELSLGSPSQVSFDYTNSFSFAIWVKHAAPLLTSNRNQALMGKNFNYSLQTGGISATGTVFGFSFGVRVRGTGTTVSNSTSTIYPIGPWYHLVGVYNASDRTCRIYVNSVNASSSNASTVDFIDSGQPFYIGGDDAIIGSDVIAFNGYVDDARVYNYALSQAEISFLYNQGLGTEENTSLPNCYDSEIIDNSPFVTAQKNTFVVTAGCFVPNAVEPQTAGFILLENNDYVLLENGDKIKTEV